MQGILRWLNSRALVLLGVLNILRNARYFTGRGRGPTTVPSAVTENLVKYVIPMVRSQSLESPDGHSLQGCLSENLGAEKPNNPMECGTCRNVDKHRGRAVSARQEIPNTHCFIEFHRDCLGGVTAAMVKLPNRAVVMCLIPGVPYHSCSTIATIRAMG